MLLTSMEGKTSGWQDSLLNPANTKYAMEVRGRRGIALAPGSSSVVNVVLDPAIATPISRECDAAL